MTGGGASWQPGSADWSVPTWLTAGRAFLEWSCMFVSYKNISAERKRAAKRSRPGDSGFINSLVLLTLNLFFKNENETHFTEQHESFQDAFTDPEHVWRSVRSVPRTSHWHFTATWKIALVGEETSLQGFIPSGTLWWHHGHSKRAWPIHEAPVLKAGWSTWVKR